MEERVTIVCGRRIEQVGTAVLRQMVRQYEGVVVDLGTGDGRWLYRLARARPTLMCFGVDANADRMRKISHRARRRPARGGLPNIRFIAAAVEALPAGLRAVADEVWVSYPWGSLLQAVLAPDTAILRRVAGVLKPQGLLRVAINESVLDQATTLGKMGIASRSPQDLYDEMCAGYSEAGLKVTTWRHDGAWIRSSWGARLGQGGGVCTLWVEAVKDGNGRDLWRVMRPGKSSVHRRSASCSQISTVDLGGEATTSEFTEGMIALVRARLIAHPRSVGRINTGGCDGFRHVAALSSLASSGLSAVTGGRHSPAGRYNEESGPGR